MKKLVLSLALLGGLGFTLPAQLDDTSLQQGKRKEMQNASPEERAKMETQMAEKKLSLTADQKPKWEAASLVRIKANEPYRQKMQGTTTPEERKELHKNMRTNKEAFDKTVTAFLTPDQKAKWDAVKKERHEKRMEKRGKGKPEGIDGQNGN